MSTILYPIVYHAKMHYFRHSPQTVFSNQVNLALRKTEYKNNHWAIAQHWVGCFSWFFFCYFNCSPVYYLNYKNTTHFWILNSNLKFLPLLFLFLRVNILMNCSMKLNKNDFEHFWNSSTCFYWLYDYVLQFKITLKSQIFKHHNNSSSA